MNVRIVVHAAEEGCFRAEIPALPGCISQGQTMDELLANVHEAIGAWLAAGEPEEPPVSSSAAPRYDPPTTSTP
jgi:predicted RNase H-like HicB family nuclease